jgi:hypothetical protein
MLLTLLLRLHKNNDHAQSSRSKQRLATQRKFGTDYCQRAHCHFFGFKLHRKKLRARPRDGSGRIMHFDSPPMIGSQRREL